MEVGRWLHGSDFPSRLLPGPPRMEFGASVAGVGGLSRLLWPWGFSPCALEPEGHLLGAGGLAWDSGSLFSLQQELFLPPLLHKTSKNGSNGNSGCRAAFLMRQHPSLRQQAGLGGPLDHHSSFPRVTPAWSAPPYSGSSSSSTHWTEAAGVEWVWLPGPSLDLPHPRPQEAGLPRM